MMYKLSMLGLQNIENVSTGGCVHSVGPFLLIFIFPHLVNVLQQYYFVKFIFSVQQAQGTVWQNSENWVGK